MSEVEINSNFNFKKAIIEEADNIKRIGLVKHGAFHNNHEVYAVLLEEYQEAKEELNLVKKNFKKMWEKTRKDEDITNEIKYIANYSIAAIHELVDLIAVCKKALMNEDDKNRCIICGSTKRLEQQQGFYYCEEHIENHIL